MSTPPIQEQYENICKIEAILANNFSIIEGEIHSIAVTGVIRLKEERDALKRQLGEYREALENYDNLSCHIPNCRECKLALQQETNLCDVHRHLVVVAVESKFKLPPTIASTKPIDEGAVEPPAP